MYLLLLGIVLCVLKWAWPIEPVASLPWYWVTLPLLGAVLWWAWADWSGYTKRKSVERDETRKQARIERQREQLGMLGRSNRGRGRR